MMGEALYLTMFTVISIMSAYIYLRRQNLGELAITTQDVAYDKEQYGSILNYDRHCFYIDGKPIIIISGEFHYWRLPDKSRWEHILRLYKAAGLNCIRIYFHWGFHSRDEGIYNWDGPRDVGYLMSLCEKLELFVMAAPGPYICAETQAGGLPIWLASKRSVRLRHSYNSFFRLYDDEYSKYCREWYSNLIPHLREHQITYKRGGCLIAFQIENEAFEKIKGIPLGLADDMRNLCKVARDMGITVPLFTNDAWEEGSFVVFILLNSP
jgi:beta-galactosidase GanA